MEPLDVDTDLVQIEILPDCKKYREDPYHDEEGSETVSNRQSYQQLPVTLESHQNYSDEAAYHQLNGCYDEDQEWQDYQENYG